MSDVRTIEDKYRALAGRLDEAMLRLWAAVEARTLGRGGVSTVAKATGLSRTTIYMTVRRLLRDKVGYSLLARQGVELSEVTMPAKRYKVTLESDERGDLEKLISRGKGAARRLAHARILLHADQGEGRPGRIDAEIAEAVGVSVATIERVRQRFVEEGLEAALNPRPPRRLYPRKLDGEAEARLIALACSPPPEGRARWTLRVLAERMVVLGYVETVSHETVRTTLQETNLNHI